MIRLLVVLIAVLVPSTAALAQFPQDPALEAYWPFTGDASDATGNGNDGVALGGITPAPDRFGHPDHAYAFDGIDGHIDCGNVLNSITVPFSVAAWVRADALPATSSDHPVVVRTDDRRLWYYGFWFSLLYDGAIQLSYGDGGYAGPFSRRSKISPAGVIVPGQWTHIACIVRGPTDMSIYVNALDVGGSYAGSGGAMVHSGDPFHIGRSADTNATHYGDGLIDDIYVYNRALSVDEVQILYEGPTSLEPSSWARIKAAYK